MSDEWDEPTGEVPQGISYCAGDEKYVVKQQDFDRALEQQVQFAVGQWTQVYGDPTPAVQDAVSKIREKIRTSAFRTADEVLNWIEAQREQYKATAGEAPIGEHMRSCWILGELADDLRNARQWPPLSRAVGESY